MRKLAPVVLSTTLIALCSGSAFALGDRAKSKNAPSVNSSTSATATTGANGNVGDRSANPATSSSTVNTPPSSGTDTTTGSSMSGSTTMSSAPTTTALAPSTTTPATAGTTVGDASAKPSTNKTPGIDPATQATSTTSYDKPAATAEHKDKSKPKKKVASNKSPDQIGADTRAKSSPDAQKGEASGGGSSQ